MPTETKEKPVKAVYIRLPAKVHDALAERARLEDRSLNNLIVRLLRSVA